MARSVTIKAGKNGVMLPNGVAYDAGATVTLTDAQFLSLSANALANYVTDNGIVPGVEDEVITQGTSPTLTSAHAAGATPTQAEFNAVVDDVANLKTALTGTGKALL